MSEEWKYTAVYALIIAGLLIQVALALMARTVGLLAPIGILAISGVEASFVFLVFMQGKYGPRSITAFMALSLGTLVPLFIALVFSVAFPQHAVSAP